ncbi:MULTISPECIES: hypothetical protein [Photorhabdus]|uniref:Uncharacterized protein n=1 Tax=Photorhabdus bodei TaxID=2029681 RepID=A0A329XAJ7_9GAMM|nr:MULTISPECIES: hypothetical protein [Photorhabdus]PQQ33193.1 hypothetical protein C6H69_12120 [Photorhabdus luminescens]MBS9434288.1 hypothetical protein [Photorhabdus hainanensis]NDL05030.1 hypothetical protein [Photorhabdus bodei]NDL09363.1 hypothetical protein [Photorhabdus bodei]PQQ40452.1 hypothetical protein C6H65_15140 [Photorhabdus luminescens]
MNEKRRIFSKAWFKDLFFIWIKDLLWNTIPFIVIIAWSAMAAGCFPDMWGRLTLLGIVVVTIFVFLRIRKS